MEKLKCMLSNKRAIAFCIYYIVFLAFSIISILRGWNLRLPVIILLLFMILISLGGDENYASTFEAYQRDPLIAQNLPPRREKFDGLKFKTALLLVFPPIIYLIIDFLRRKLF